MSFVSKLNADEFSRAHALLQQMDDKVPHIKYTFSLPVMLTGRETAGQMI